MTTPGNYPEEENRRKLPNQQGFVPRNPGEGQAPAQDATPSPVQTPVNPSSAPLASPRPPLPGQPGSLWKPVQAPLQFRGRSHPLVRQYLKDLLKHLRWVPQDRRKRFGWEVTGHLDEISATMDGDDHVRYRAAIRRFGDPETIARQFIEAYGYGRRYLIAMSLLGFFLGLLTIPIQIPVQTQTQGLCFGGPLLMTVLVFVIIIRTSIRAGKWTGFTVGFSCGLSRLLILGLLFVAMSSNSDVEKHIAVPEGVVAAMVMVSILMALSGYLPGKSLQKYQGD